MSNINDYIKPSASGSNRKDINKILSLIHDIVAQEPEDEGNKERIMFTPHVKRRTTTVIFGAPNVKKSEVRSKENFVFRRVKPTTVDSYDLIHTQVGAGVLTFPVKDTVLGCRCDADGTNYITIDDDDLLDPTAEISIALKLSLPASSGGFVILEKVNQYRLRVVDTNTLEWAIFSGGSYKTAVTFVYTPSTKYSVIASYKSTSSGQKLYINGTLEDSDSETGAMVGTSNKLGILATGAGASIAPNGVRIAIVTIQNDEVDSSFITDYENGILDTSAGNEITTIEFAGDDSPTPDAVAGLFKSA